MAPQPASTPKVCFGPFEFDPTAGELKKYDSRVRLTGQPILILTMLLYRPGEAVTREEFRRYLWAGQAQPEADAALDQAIHRLRQTLGEPQQYIETTGDGYRFIAPVHKLHEAPAPVVIDLKPAARATPPRPPAGLLAAGAGAVIALALLAWWFLRPAGPAPAATRNIQPPPGFVLETLTDRQTFALSPDGSRLAFTALDRKGTPHVFLQDLDQTKTPRELPGTAGAEMLFWAQEGEALFVSVSGKLHRVEPATNRFQAVSDVPAHVLNGTWLPTGRLLLAGWQTSLSLSPSEGAPRDLGARFHWAQTLPDGAHVLHSLFDLSSGHHQVRAALVDGVASDGWDVVQTDSRAQFAPSANGDGGHLLFVRDGNLMAQPFDPAAMRVKDEAFLVARHVTSSRSSGAADFSVSGRGVIAYRTHAPHSQLVWLDRQGREVSSLGGADVTVKSGRLAPDGQQIVASLYDVERGEQDLWLIDTRTGTRRRVTVGVAQRDDPVWSHDGHHLAYSRGSAPRAAQAFVRDLREDRESNLDTSSPGLQSQEMPVDWSPDGRFVLVVSTAFPRLAAEQQSDIAVVDLLRDKRRRPLIQSRFDESLAAFAPDGRWLAFVSNESGEPEIYVQEFEGGEEPALLHVRKLVTRGGAQVLRWRRDGKELFCLGLDGRVSAIPVTLGAKPVFGPPSVLFTLGADAQAAGPGRLAFDVSADGERFLIARLRGETSGGIVVKRNWAPAESR